MKETHAIYFMASSMALIEAVNRATNALDSFLSASGLTINIISLVPYVYSTQFDYRYIITLVYTQGGHYEPTK